MNKIFGEKLKKINHMIFLVIAFVEFKTLKFCKCDIPE